MKKSHFLVTLAWMSIYIMFFSSCAKDNGNISSQTKAFTSSLRAVKWPEKPKSNHSQSERDSTEKKETSLDPKDPFFDEIRSDFSATLGSPITSLDLEVVGVLVDRNTPCPSQYTDLRLTMPTEDDNNNSSENYNWWGTSGLGFIPHPNNLPSAPDYGIEVCIVPMVYFGRLRDDNYAVLRLSYGYPNGVSVLFHYEDLEDDTPGSYVWDSSTGQVYDANSGDPDKNYPDPTHGPLGFAHNFSLSFLYYPKMSGGAASFSSIPGLNKEYGVFGSFNYGNSGNLYFDDEDDNNVNAQALYLYDDATNSYSWEYNTTSINSILHNVFLFNRNTTYYTSKVY